MLSLKVRRSFSLHGKFRCMSIVSFLVDSVVLFKYLYLLNMKPLSSLSLLTGSRNATSALHTFFVALIAGNFEQMGIYLATPTIQS
jgi:hypothetical protein